MYCKISLELPISCNSSGTSLGPYDKGYVGFGLGGSILVCQSLSSFSLALLGALKKKKKKLLKSLLF